MKAGYCRGRPGLILRGALEGPSENHLSVSLHWQEVTLRLPHVGGFPARCAYPQAGGTVEVSQLTSAMPARNLRPRDVGIR